LGSFASGLVNTARMVGATLGVAVLGAICAEFAGASGHVAAGLAPAFILGGIAEVLGAAAAFAFIRRGSLQLAGTLDDMK
jgi:MFS transporter, DHA2 family, methylenomycin A resistance protein